MTRKEFIKICSLLGIGMPLQSSLVACGDDDSSQPKFNGKVIIVGAGPGGLSAGYLLQQQGIDFEILEASSVYGGRTRINTDFADFPIPLGAEWIETDTGIFHEIVNDPSVQLDIDTVTDDPDHKFVNSSWFTFFEQYVVPSISDKIIYNTAVQAIEYSGDQVILTTHIGERVADRVIVSVPLKVLQDGDVSFSPSLPGDKQAAIDNTTVWEGFKAFFEFSDNFYGEGHAFTIAPETDGQKIYYDAALGQNTSRHILGLFVVGKPAQDFITRSGNELRDFILSELNGLFDNQATSNYIKHITQNWNNEPFIKGGYMSDHADWRQVRTLGESVADKVYFAGGAYTDGEDWVSVHTAAQSARRAVIELVG